MILWGENGTAIWDSEAAPTVTVFGEPGTGKTTLARHAIRSWLRSAGTVVLGTTFPDYENLKRFVHLTTPEEAIQFGRVADAASTREENLLIVLDEPLRISIDSMQYLSSREESNVCWLILDRSPYDPERMPSIGVGRLRERLFKYAYGADAPFPDMRTWGVGHTVRESGGRYVESQVPASAMEGLFETTAVYKRRLPTFARRRFYTPAALQGEPEADTM